MTPARAHRERMAALAAQSVDPKPVVSSDGGGQPAPAIIDRTPAMIHREQVAATAIVTAPETATSAEDRIAAQIVLRLTHDLRDLKEIKGVDAKVAAKRRMLPEYQAWIDAIVTADAGAGTGLIGEVVPTCMVWLIDTGDFAAALDLVPFLLKHNVAMPARYKRDVATVVVDEITAAAQSVQALGEAFPANILARVADLVDGIDMHNEVRAKLLKAIGVEQLRAAEDMDANESRAPLETALATLKEAHRLWNRVGVLDRVKRAEKLLKALPPITDQNNEQGGQQAA